MAVKQKLVPNNGELKVNPYEQMINNQIEYLEKVEGGKSCKRSEECRNKFERNIAILKEKAQKVLEKLKDKSYADDIYPAIAVIPTSIIPARDQIGMYWADSYQQYDSQSVYKISNGFLYNENKMYDCNSSSEPYFMLGVKVKDVKNIKFKEGIKIPEFREEMAKNSEILTNHVEGLAIASYTKIVSDGGEFDSLLTPAISWDGFESGLVALQGYNRPNDMVGLNVSHFPPEEHNTKYHPKMGMATYEEKI